ncbi:MAG: prepilin peptidase [Planctomycetaceae bacterium]
MSVSQIVDAIPGSPSLAPAIANGVLALLLTCWLTRRGLRACETRPGFAPFGWGACAGGLAMLLTWGCLTRGWQQTPEVMPGEWSWLLRPTFHSLLITLLAVASATDLRTYYILDSTTVNGMLLALVGATLLGELQLVHIWVDWNAEVPQLQGPYIPGWLAEYPRLHGLAWSGTGLVVGGGIVWLARVGASMLLGQEALGFGDVTLMAMIGAFIGWQPVIIAFLIAPVCAVLIGVLVRVVSSRTYVPYGPFLALATLLVLFGWRAIWMFELNIASDRGAPISKSTFALRRLFGDAEGLAILGGMFVVGLLVLLGLWRMYLSIPVNRRSSDGAPELSAAQAAASAVAPASTREPEKQELGTQEPRSQVPGSQASGEHESTK